MHNKHEDKTFFTAVPIDAATENLQAWKLSFFNTSSVYLFWVSAKSFDNAKFFYVC